ncbi:hypothetical protein [Paractinoplanes brasiliensis]|uniref:Uncharacterized protein n=1 Tax=Paractinoplanes brasiliensis TaxID=52695 RepID=A0A4R6JNL0_9ACTN|nr:hypothetical protein [Actinoplanes brasiliensis]TDO36971.1 hypothetical protein C8E87_0563 [Actinoplanes brasiliensis]GID30494.1 hypothetical protein Abr02nite_54770 [Actinoplanes brasiliensis]
MSTASDEAIDDAELHSFLTKLNAWADALPPGEKALLRLVLERSAGRGPDRDEGIDFTFPAEQGLDEVVGPFLRELVEAGALQAPSATGDRKPEPDRWQKSSEPWKKSG